MGPVLIGFVVVLAVMVVVAISVSSKEIVKMGENKGKSLSSITMEPLKTSLMFDDAESSKGNIANLQNDEGVVMAEVFDKDKKRVGIVFGKALVEEKLKSLRVEEEEKEKKRTEVVKEFTDIYTASFDTADLDKIGLEEGREIEDVGKEDKDKKNLIVSLREVMGKECQFFSSKIPGEAGEVLGYLNLALSLDAMKASNNIVSSLLIMIGVISLVLIGLGSSYMLSRMVRPLIDATEIMQELSEGEGDLTIRLDVKTHDEIGRLSTNFNNFIEKLKHIVSRVKDSSDEINNGTREISAGSEDLSTRTSEQAASITETSTTLEGFTSIVKVNTDNSEEVRSRLENFNADMETKKDLMVNVTSTMKEIEDSSKKIDNIINVINDISFQTNLLALNAAVEAARAGEAGRGFAVVAAEVRNLAQKTAESSKTIQDIVTQNVDSTKKGMLLVNETSEFFAAIMDIMNELVGKIKEISEGSKEQSTGVEQINQAILQLENVINQNAALVEELSATSKSMSANTHQLNDLVNRFKL
jgi:methyl-accepting chemotaxis protein